MTKLKPTKKSIPKVHKPKKITVGELVLRQVEKDTGKKWVELAKDFESSQFAPVAQALQDTLDRTRKLGEMLNTRPYLNDTFLRMAEIGKQISEPMQKLAEPMRQLNAQIEKLREVGAFNLPPPLIAAVRSIPKLPMPNLIGYGADETETIEPQLTYSTPPIIVLKNQVNNLEAKLEEMAEQVKQTVAEKFDNFAKEFRIPVGFKNAFCYCKFCGNLLVKFEGIFFFTEGTMKCGSCNKTLQLPRDMKITAN